MSYVGLLDLVKNPKSDIVDGPFGSNMKSSDYIEYGIPVIKLQNIKSNRFLEKNIDYVSKTKAEELKRHTYQAGDIIITKLGDPLGVSCIMPESFPSGVIVADLIRLRPNPDVVDTKFLCYQLNSPVIANQFKELTKGTTRPRVNLTLVRAIQAWRPDLTTQKKIVKRIEALFSEVDSGAEEFQRAIQNLELYKQSILSSAIQGKLVPQDPNDEPASKLIEIIRAKKEKLIKEKKLRNEKPPLAIHQSEVPFELPKGWEWIRLNELVSSLGDGLHGTPVYTENGMYFFINGNNLVDGKIEIKANTKRVSKDEFKKHQKPLSDRTVLLSINGTIGNVAFYNNENVILGKSACYFNLMEPLDKNYIKLVLNSDYFLNHAHNTATGSTIKNVSLKTMRDFPVPLPPLSQQKEITKLSKRILNAIDDSIMSIKAEANQSSLLKQAILKSAFEGKLL